MKKIMLAAALAAMPVGAWAEDMPQGHEVTGNVSFVSEYMFRGITQSDEAMAIQGGLDIAYESGFYAGIWGSNVDFNEDESTVDGASAEIDLYAGYTCNCKDLNLTTGFAYYAYPGADDNLNYDFWELLVAADHTFGDVDAGLSVNWANDYFGASGNAVYTSLYASKPLTDTISLSGHVGYQSIEENSKFGAPDYMDWSVALTKEWNGLEFSLAYVDTNIEKKDVADGAEARGVFSISKSF